MVRAEAEYVPNARETARKSGVRAGGEGGGELPSLWVNNGRSPYPQFVPANPNDYPFFYFNGATEFLIDRNFRDTTDTQSMRLLVAVGVAGPPDTGLTVSCPEIGLFLSVPLDVAGLHLTDWQAVTSGTDVEIDWTILNPDGHPLPGETLGDLGTFIGFGLMQLQVKGDAV